MATSKKQATPSPETQAEAMQIARATQKPGQTKLIAQGIQKGIEQYKKQQKAKSRERDKLRKKQNKEKLATQTTAPTENIVQDADTPSVVYRQHWLPWLLLIASWAGFAAYLLQSA